MTINIQGVSLESIADGAIPEKAALELQRVYANFLDEKFPSSDPRKIDISLTFKAIKGNRKNLAVDFSIKTKLAQANGAQDMIILSKEGKNITASRADENQMKIFEGKEIEGDIPRFKKEA